MDHALSQLISRRYGLVGISDVQLVRPGTVAQVWRLSSTQGEFLVRTLTGPGQGEREWTIFRHLAGHGFTQTPYILPTADGAPAAELDGVWYQVQRYCPGTRPDPAQPGVPREMAKLAVRLEAALVSCPAICSPADRFDLATVWAQFRLNWTNLSLPLSLEEADREVARCCGLPIRDRQVIHGDLGPWNLLRPPEGELLVIDFGEARMGDPYFDLASLLGGLVNHSPAELRQRVCGEFLTEYQRHAPLDLPRLREQLELWVWRGLAQCVRSGSNWAGMAARFYNALTWAKEELWTIN